MANTGRLEGKVALVTGAARGTGESIARHFVAEGARVIAVDVRDELGTGVTDELGEAARYRNLDVTSERGWQETVEEIRANEGRLDILVNNAAVLLLQAIDDTSAEDFERVLRVNVLGPFLGTKACLPLLREAGAASIVNVGSIDSVTGVTTGSAYTASKFALNGLTRVTALENGKYGVRANCLCPRAGSNEMTAEQFGQAGSPRVKDPNAPYDPARGPLGRSGFPDDVAPAAAFLASDESAYISGTDLLIDGAYRAGEYVEVPGRFRFDP